MKKLFLILFVSAFSFLTAFSQEKKVPYGNNPANGRFYEIRGIKMYAETYGSGAPLLIIHGNGGSIKDFSDQIPYFAKKYKVILADGRSHGKTKDAGDSLTYEMMTDDLDALLSAMGVDSANVIGWSDGGINGLLLAIRHPKKVKKLAITGANLWPDSTAVVPGVVTLMKTMYDKITPEKNKNEANKVAYKLTRLMVEQPNITLEQLKTIQAPTLVIGGDHDVILEEHTMQIYKALPKAYLWILPNSGHATLLAYKNEFNAVVGKFLKEPYKTYTVEARFY